MMTKAAIVKDDYIVYSSSIPLIYEDTPMACNAILTVLVKAPKDEIAHGALYCNEAPRMVSAQAIIAAELAKVVYQEEALDSEQRAAIDMLEQYSVVVVHNSNILL